jgi:transaldolase
MTTPLGSIIQAGTKLWLDSVDPELVATNRALGITGATSNPIIISDLVKTGRFDDQLIELMQSQRLSDHDAAWSLNDEIVTAAELAFRPVWESTKGDDGYVSFEVDPLLEDADCKLSLAEKSAKYAELGKKWAAGHPNRMIKVPATPGGLGALEELAAAGITLNVTLIFSMRQYEAARDAIWRGAQRRKTLDAFKSVYSIFISRVDVYSEKHAADLSSEAQGQVGLVNVKHIWRANQKFWSEHSTPLKQEIVFASTGTKKPSDPPWKYVEALVGSDIQTNPPATNDAVQKSGKTFTRSIDRMPSDAIVAEIAAKVNPDHLERTLMDEGLAKFAQPQKELLALIAKKRESLVGAA